MSEMLIPEGGATAVGAALARPMKVARARMAARIVMVEDEEVRVVKGMDKELGGMMKGE